MLCACATPPTGAAPSLAAMLPAVAFVRASPETTTTAWLTDFDRFTAVVTVPPKFFDAASEIPAAPAAWSGASKKLVTRATNHQAFGAIMLQGEPWDWTEMDHPGEILVRHDPGPSARFYWSMALQKKYNQEITDSLRAQAYNGTGNPLRRPDIWGP